MEFYFESKKNDVHGRLMPVKVDFIDGRMLIGHCIAEMFDGGNRILHFRVIENIDLWNDNKIQFGSNVITFNECEVLFVNDFDASKDGK